MPRMNNIMKRITMRRVVVRSIDVFIFCFLLRSDAPIRTLLTRKQIVSNVDLDATKARTIALRILIIIMYIFASLGFTMTLQARVYEDKLILEHIVFIIYTSHIIIYTYIIF